MTTEDKPNRNQAAVWNDTGGPIWVELQGVLDRMLAPFATRLVDEVFPGEGGRVLDVGCGAGATTLMMTRRLGPSGFGLGADISRPLVEAAREQAAAAGLANAEFVEADAQVHTFVPHHFDALLSRFGVMFFDDPPAAFANLHHAARPGASLAFVAWRTPAENPFMTVAPRAIAPIIGAPPADPHAPGPFAFADPDRTRGILEAGGWTDVSFEPYDVPTEISSDELARYATRLGGVALALRNAPDEPTRARITDAVHAGYEPFVRDQAARFTAAAWLVRARA